VDLVASGHDLDAGLERSAVERTRRRDDDDPITRTQTGKPAITCYRRHVFAASATSTAHFRLAPSESK
jgi:hypothetical protein